MLVTRPQGSNATVGYASMRSREISTYKLHKISEKSALWQRRCCFILAAAHSGSPQCCTLKLKMSLKADVLLHKSKQCEVKYVSPSLFFAVLILNYTCSSHGKLILCLPSFLRHLSGSAFSTSLFISTTCSDVPSIKLHYAAKLRIRFLLRSHRFLFRWSRSAHAVEG